MTVNFSYKHSDLSEAIIGIFYEVYNELGYGFLESVYRNSLQLALLAKGLRVEAEVAVPVFFRGKNVGDFRADAVVNRSVLLELKTAEAISIAHEALLLNYLRATKLEVGLILNFGPKAQVRRLAYDNTRKRFKSQRAGASQ
ncbi:MAG TPA: GxxExxY protein [Candidatus Angelobacter sp.]|nr:GxxExxY protein [Candidatus Angelobacter sp.]